MHPTSRPWAKGESLGDYFEKRGVSRRDFLAFCGQMTAALGLAATMLPQLASALAALTCSRPGDTTA